MSNLRSLKKPKKHRKNYLFVVIALLLVAGIIAGIVAIAHGGGYRVKDTVVKTEIVRE